MSLVLTYMWDCHERTIERGSLEGINKAIRSLYDENGSVMILRIEHVRDHTGPRTWAIEYPPAPPAGTRVMNGASVPFLVQEDGRVGADGLEWPWEVALRKFGPLTEVVETEVEAAARRLREAGYTEPTLERLADHGDDVRRVLAHVLNGGTLP